MNGYTNCCTSKLWNALSAIKEEGTIRTPGWNHKGIMPYDKSQKAQQSLRRGHTATTTLDALQETKLRRLPRVRREGGPDHKKDGTGSASGETEHPGMQTSGSRSQSTSTWTSSRIAQALSWNWKTAGFSCLKYRSPGNTKLDSLFQPLVTTSYSKY